MEHTQQSQKNTPTQAPISYTKKKQVFFVLVLVCIVVLVGTVWFIIAKYKTLKNSIHDKTPIETLTILKEISDPVITTPKEKSAVLKTLSKQSDPVKSTEASRMAQLKMLRQ